MSDAPDVTEPERFDSAAFMRADQTWTFGPSFFLGHLGRFVRDHCPSPDEQLPLVQIRLVDGRALDLCHIIGVSPRWVMLAVRESSTRPTDMAIEIVPFQMVQGVHIGSRRGEGCAVGFFQSHSPSVIAAETLLRGAINTSTAIG